MFRKLTLSMAVAAACAIGNSASAQTGDSSTGTKAGTPAQMASYSQEYSSVGASYGAAQLPQAMAYGQAWGGAASNRDSSRFYHYPYVFYPQNFQGDDYYKSSNSMYYRYRPEAQIPVYNKHWHNYYPSQRRYHWGHHFILDVF